MVKKTTSPAPTFSKPPVVTIMGHVDHGKTTLLDFIRQSNITSHETGGITQKIGAYQITHKGKPITFIDTPGHAAFSKMRAHGASITDIIVLVVAADDGVKPQTKESIQHIIRSGAHVIVAINKIDLKTAAPEMVKAQLYEEGIQVEGYGGSVPVIEISARAGKNIDKLLDTIILLAEIEQLSTHPQASLQAVVIESALKKNQGPTATLLIRQGQLKLGDELVEVSTNTHQGKVKRLLGDLGQTLKYADVSTPVEVIGFKQVPSVGLIFTNSQPKSHPVHQELIPPIEAPLLPTQSDLPQELQPAEPTPRINIILRTDTLGSLEAICQNLTSEIHILSSATGEVSESDVMMAQATNSAIIAFNVKINPSAKKIADLEKIPMHSYKIIYELLEDFEKQVLKLLEPTIDEQETGSAQVLATFNIKGVAIYGCKITSGKISLNDRIHHKRQDKILGDAGITSIKQGKIDVKSIESPQECGLVTKPVLNVQIGDLLVAFKKQT